MTKSEYRAYFVLVKKYVKLKHILIELGMEHDQSNLSRFIKSSKYDYLFSTDKLDKIIQQIDIMCEKLT